MEYIYCGKYRSKLNGFQYKWLRGGERVARDHFENDQIRSFYSVEYGPILNAMLWVRDDGRLSFCINGLGRPILGYGHASPWEDGNDSKILSVFITDESADDRQALYALFRAFTSDPFEYGRRLLSTLIPLEGDEDYGIDADKLDEIMESCREDRGNIPMAAELRKNTVIAYYSYGEFGTVADLSRFRSYLYSCGISHHADIFYNGKPSDGDYAVVAKRLKTGCTDIPYAFKAAVNKLAFSVKGC